MMKMLLKNLKKKKSKQPPVTSLYKIAVGTIGIEPSYFLDEMSLKAYLLASEGYYETNKEEWERTRILAYNTITPHLKKKISLSEFMPFMWDEKKVRKSTVRDFNLLTKIASDNYGL